MRAWVNDIENQRIELRRVPDPAPGPGELLIEVGAAGVNRADLAMRAGRYRPGFGSVAIAGIEGAGVVVGVGPGCERFGVGDRMMGMCTGTYAELCVLDDAIAIAVPDAVGIVEAAGLPVGCCTEHNAIVGKAALRAGESVLITAATSGVGDPALKIAKLMGAGTVLGTTRSPSRANRVTAADHVLVSSDGLVDAVRNLTGEVGVDIVIDHVGGDIVIDHVGGEIVNDLIDAASIGARIVSVGRLAGATSEINVDELARKQISFIGVSFRTRTREEYAAIAQTTAADLAGPISCGALQPLIAETFDFEQAEEAQEALAEGDYVGKLVLRVLEEQSQQ